MTENSPVLRGHRAALLVLLLIVVATVAFITGHHSRSEATSTSASATSSPSSPVDVATTDPRTGRTASTLSAADQERADYVPTTRADATPEERTRTDIDIAVRGFIRGWALHGSVAERRTALEPYVSTPVMLDAFSLTDPNNVPDGGLAAPPVIAGAATDSATVLTVFRDSSSVTIHMVRLDTGWRVYQVDHG